MARVRQTYSGSAVCNFYDNITHALYATITRPTRSDYCSDLTSPKTDNPLDIRHYTYSGGDADWSGTGHYAQGSLIGSGVALPSFNATAPIDAWIASITALRIASATAPTKPAVFSLTNLIEIRELPRMLKHAGDLLHKLVTKPTGLTKPGELASATLAYQFGWKPLFGDLLKMMDFARLVANRQREIGVLNSGKTIRKRIQLGGSTFEYFDPVHNINSLYGVLINVPVRLSGSYKGWATIRWKLADLHQLGKTPTWMQAFNSLYGITPGEVPIQIWKALPWTWLIDWFADISNHLEVSKNMITYSPSGICLMCTTLGEYTFYKTFGPGMGKTFQQGHIQYTRKQRFVLPVSSITTLRLSVPFFDTFKLSVLSSLTVVKLRRRLA